MYINRLLAYSEIFMKKTANKYIFIYILLCFFISVCLTNKNMNELGEKSKFFCLIVIPHKTILKL